MRGSPCSTKRSRSPTDRLAAAQAAFWKPADKLLDNLDQNG
jgi:hypothetical protein